MTARSSYLGIENNATFLTLDKYVRWEYLFIWCVSVSFTNPKVTKSIHRDGLVKAAIRFGLFLSDKRVKPDSYLTKIQIKMHFL